MGDAPVCSPADPVLSRMSITDEQALGNGNTVGALGYFLGGGASITTSTTGYGAEQIVSARIATAQGELLNATEETHPDLLWALRGAGHFCGLVTHITIKTLPLSILGNDKGVTWAGMFIFPLQRAEEVRKAMRPIMDNSEYLTSGLMMIMAPPPHRNPSLMISARLAGNPEKAKIAYKPLYDLDPLVAGGAEVPLQNASDAKAALCAHGDFKRFSVVGLHSFNISAFLETVNIGKDMISECPDSINTAFNFQWDSRFAPLASSDCAMSLSDVRFWQNYLIWHTDPESRVAVDRHADRCISVVRSHGNGVDFIDFVNGTRTGPVRQGSRGVDRLERLQSLKRHWDPHGIFTDQLILGWFVNPEILATSSCTNEVLSGIDLPLRITLY